MTAPEFSDAEMVDASWTPKMIDVLLRDAADAEADAVASTAPPAQWAAFKARLYRAIAARLTATSAGWQPPPEAERPDGFRCLGSIQPDHWRTIEALVPPVGPYHWRWLDNGTLASPVRFAQLPPTPTQKVTK